MRSSPAPAVGARAGQGRSIDRAQLHPPQRPARQSASDMTSGPPTTGHTRTKLVTPSGSQRITPAHRPSHLRCWSPLPPRCSAQAPQAAGQAALPRKRDATAPGHSSKSSRGGGTASGAFPQKPPDIDPAFGGMFGLDMIASAFFKQEHGRAFVDAGFLGKLHYQGIARIEHSGQIIFE